MVVARVSLDSCCSSPSDGDGDHVSVLIMLEPSRACHCPSCRCIRDVCGVVCINFQFVNGGDGNGDGDGDGDDDGDVGGDCGGDGDGDGADDGDADGDGDGDGKCNGDGVGDGDIYTDVDGDGHGCSFDTYIYTFRHRCYHLYYCCNGMMSK